MLTNLLKTIQLIVSSAEPKHELQRPQEQPPIKGPKEMELQIYKDYLTINKYSRPGLKRKGVKAIEIHWVGNANTSAKFNRDFFESRKGGKYSYGSAHYIVDLDGKIYQVIPEEEVAYSSGTTAGYKSGIVGKLGNPPWWNTISIEMCHPRWDGQPTKETYTSLVNLTAYLCNKYGLLPKDLLRHYDITGKECPRWFVTHPEAWDQFREDVHALLI